MPEIMDIEAFQKDFKYELITAAPVYTLAQCMAASRWSDMEELKDAPAEIAEKFRKSVYLFSEEQLAFVRFAAEQTDKRVALSEAIPHQPFGVFYWNEFAHLFLCEDAFYLVIPEELAAIFREVTAEENFAAKNARNRELSLYASGLLELYGAYEVSWFTSVWNQHHKEKITDEEAMEFLSDMADFHADFHFIEDWVVHDCLDDDDFDELLEETEDIPYYMPPKSVIRALSTWDRFEGDKGPAEREMDAFLAEHVADERELEDLQFSIAYSCVQLDSPTKIKEMLADADAPLDSEDFCTAFERLYNKLREETHIWYLKGHTPYQYREATGEELPRFKLPKNKRRGKK
jgi:hypothetical protein